MSRIGEKEDNRSLPQAPHRGDSSRQDEEREGGRNNKRTAAADREQDQSEPPFDNNADNVIHPPKRPRVAINRSRYPTAAGGRGNLFKHPIEMEKSSTARSGRKG